MSSKCALGFAFVVSACGHSAEPVITSVDASDVSCWRSFSQSMIPIYTCVDAASPGWQLSWSSD